MPAPKKGGAILSSNGHRQNLWARISPLPAVSKFIGARHFRAPERSVELLLSEEPIVQFMFGFKAPVLGLMMACFPVDRFALRKYGFGSRVSCALSRWIARLVGR